MKRIAVSLYDFSCTMLFTWRDAGYECWAVDIMHSNKGDLDGIFKLRHDLKQPWLPPFSSSDVAIVFAFPPCDHLAVSGARWFRGKGLRKLAESVQMFATAAEFCEWSEAPYMIENPVSTISTYWRKPDYTFSPHEYTGWCIDDNYTKKTCLWTGNGFVMPPASIAEGLGEPDARIHTCPPGNMRKQFRSMTPEGFARAVFEANHKGSAP